MTLNIQIFGKSKCFETKKAQRFFKERGIRFQLIDLPSKGMSRRELESVMRAVGGIGALLDEKHPDAALVSYLLPDAQAEKLLEDPSLIRLSGTDSAPRSARRRRSGSSGSGTKGSEPRCQILFRHF